MNLEYLKTYLEVVRLGSFSEVAKRLSISQPAVSFQIQKLERDLGVRLIDRGQKTIKLTDAGKRLVRFAEVVEKEQVRLMRDLDQLREEVTGNIIIAASTIPGEILLPPILGEFKALHPSVGARVDVSDSLTVISGVQSGAYDLGFCGTAPEGKELDYFKVAEDEIVLIVFPEHPFAKRKRMPLMGAGGGATHLPGGDLGHAAQPQIAPGKGWGRYREAVNEPGAGHKPGCGLCGRGGGGYSLHIRPGDQEEPGAGAGQTGGCGGAGVKTRLLLRLQERKDSLTPARRVHCLCAGERDARYLK